MTKRLTKKQKNLLELHLSSGNKHALLSNWRTGLKNYQILNYLHRAGNFKGPSKYMECHHKTARELACEIFGYQIQAYSETLGCVRPSWVQGIIQSSQHGIVMISDVEKLPQEVQKKLASVMLNLETHDLNASIIGVTKFRIRCLRESLTFTSELFGMLARKNASEIAF